MTNRWLLHGILGAGALGLLSIAAPVVQPVQAADHLDGPKVTMDAATDINDVYAWMEGGKLVLAMTVHPVATTASKFSDAALYVFHVSSSMGYGMAQTETTIVCRFDDAATQSVECWFGDDAAEYATGAVEAAAGHATASGKAKVFAGLREDPFFFNLEGFNDARSAVIAAAPALTFDMNGCPALDAGTSSTLVGMLGGTAMGADPAEDFFLDLNTLAIVVEVDPSLVNAGGPILGVWASTNAQ